MYGSVIEIHVVLQKGSYPTSVNELLLAVCIVALTTGSQSVTTQVY